MAGFGEQPKKRRDTTVHEASKRQGPGRRLVQGALAASVGFFGAGDGAAHATEKQSRPGFVSEKPLTPAMRSKDMSRPLSPRDILKLKSTWTHYGKAVGTTAFFSSVYWRNLPPTDKVLFLEDLFGAQRGLLHFGGKGGGDGGGGIDEVSPIRILMEAYRIDGWLTPIQDSYIPLLRRAALHWYPDILLSDFIQGNRLHILPEEVPAVREAFSNPKASSEAKFKFLEESQFSINPESTKRRLFALLKPAEILVSRNPLRGVDTPNDFISPSTQRSIFKDPALVGSEDVRREDLPGDILGLHLPRTLAEWQVMVARNLYFRGMKVTPENVRHMGEQIKQMRERLEEYPLFGNTVFLAHEEMRADGTPRFGKKPLLDGIRAVSQSFYFISPNVNRDAGDYRVTSQSLAKAAKETIDRIVKTPSSPTAHFTFVADAHGGGEGKGAIYLSDGQVIGESGKDSIRETARTQKLAAEQIAYAFIRRYQDLEKRRVARTRPDVIILASCFSSNIIRSIASILSKANMPLPIMIGQAEYDQYSYSDSNSRFGNTFLGHTILQWPERQGRVPSVGEVVGEDPFQKNSNPVIFIPGPDGKLMQISDAGWFEEERRFG